MSNSKTAVILAGGKGRRLLPFTTTIPKPLFPIGDKPILLIIIEQLKSFGFRDFIISVGYLAELIEAYFGDGSKFDCKITYVRESEPLGTAGPISLLPDLESAFLFMNGDILTTMDFGAGLSDHILSSALMTVCIYSKKVKSSLGILKIDEEKNVLDYTEKPEDSHWVSSGIYFLSPQIKTYVGRDERLDLPMLVRRLITQNKLVRSYIIQGEWFDIGTPDDLQLAIDYFESKKS